MDISNPANTIIGKFCSTLKATERKPLMKVLTNKNIPSTKVAEVLSENGCSVSDRTVRDYRKALGV